MRVLWIRNDNPKTTFQHTMDFIMTTVAPAFVTPVFSCEGSPVSVEELLNDYTKKTVIFANGKIQDLLGPFRTV